jgi:hypothetical protein
MDPRVSQLKKPNAMADGSITSEGAQRSDGKTPVAVEGVLKVCKRNSKSI